MASFDELIVKKIRKKSHMVMWRKSIPGREDSKCKGPGGEHLI